MPNQTIKIQRVCLIINLRKDSEFYKYIPIVINLFIIHTFKVYNVYA